MRRFKKNKGLNVDVKITGNGLDIFFNQDRLSIAYPKKIWQKYSREKKSILADNLAFGTTMFVPQILGQEKINYQTSRPLAETFLFKNGIYDMPSSALTDGKPISEYVRNFFNTQQQFKNNNIKSNKSVSFEISKKKKKTAVIPFSFGKESLLSLGLCLELGIKPILVNFVEPSNEREFTHIKKMISKFTHDTGLEVYVVHNQAGMLRYGKYFGKNTELGWGLQTTEYTMFCLPFVSYFNADYIILGNELSCDESSTDQNFLVHDCAYDQNSAWTAQQSLLTTMLLGRRVDVISLVEPVQETLIMKILLGRYAFLSQYLTSCNFGSRKDKNVRWCQECPKCGSIYAFCCAFGVDPQEVGFTENLFDQKHRHVFKSFFDDTGNQYFSVDELELAFYLADKKGFTGYSMDLFKKKILPRTKKHYKEFTKEYLDVHQPKNIPPNIWAKLSKIYREEAR